MVHYFMSRKKRTDKKEGVREREKRDGLKKVIPGTSFTPCSLKDLFQPISLFSLSDSLLFICSFFPCHKIMLFLVSSGGAWNNLQRMIKPKAWRGYLQKCDTDRVPLLGFLLLPVRRRVQAGRRQSWDRQYISKASDTKHTIDHLYLRVKDKKLFQFRVAHQQDVA